jgi:hypothetical protein
MSSDENETTEKIGNLESIKRAFSNKEYAEFRKQTPPFKYFEGKPDFIVTNRNKGFVQSET